jgi:hypothetical protein
MSVVLTSFKHAKTFSGDKFSIARFQPKGFSFAELRFLAATDKDGNKMLLRNYIDPIPGYEKALREAYKFRWPAIRGWLDNLMPENDIVLCCWCPYSNSTADQIKEFGTFACHGGLIGMMIAKYRPDIEIILDKDRQERLLPEWNPHGPQEKKPAKFTDIDLF